MDNSFLEDLLGTVRLRQYINVFLASVLLDFVFGRTLQRLYSPFVAIGIVATNFGTFLEFLIIVSVLYVLVRTERAIIPRTLQVLLIAELTLGGYMIYTSHISVAFPPEVSIFFESAFLLTIFLTLFHRMRLDWKKVGGRIFSIFLALLTFGFSLFYYYRISVVASSHYLIRLPFHLEAWWFAQILLIVNAFVFFAYSLKAPCNVFKFNIATLSKITAIPTTPLAPIIVAMIFMPRMRQYIAMYFGEVFGLTFSRIEVVFYVIATWFYITAIMILWEKGRVQKNRGYVQDSVALLILFLGGAILGFVYYYFLVIIGMLLLSQLFLVGSAGETESMQSRYKE